MLSSHSSKLFCHESCKVGWWFRPGSLTVSSHDVRYTVNLLPWSCEGAEDQFMDKDYTEYTEAAGQTGGSSQILGLLKNVSFKHHFPKFSTVNTKMRSDSESWPCVWRFSEKTYRPCLPASQISLPTQKRMTGTCANKRRVPATVVWRVSA